MDRKEITAAAIAVFWFASIGCGGRMPPDSRLSGQPGSLRTAARPHRISDDVRRPSRITTSTSNDYAPSVFPDGKAVVYVSDRHGNPDLFLRFLPGSGDVGDYPLTFQTARDTSPAVSPNGLQVAFVSYRTDSRGDLYILNLRAAGRVPEAIRKRLAERFGGLLSQPAGNGPSLQKRVSDYLERQGELVRLTDEKYQETDPSWAPDGGKIYFTRGDPEGPRIYALETLNPKNVQRITSGPGSMPAVSPDGKRLAYVVPTGGAQGGGEIRVSDVNGKEARRATEGPYDAHPSWSSDGRSLYFSRYADDTDKDGAITLSDNPSIFALDFGTEPGRGGETRRITSGDRYDLFPTEAAGRIFFASAESGGRGSSNLFSTSSEPFPFTRTQDTFDASRGLEGSDPRMAALGYETVCRKESGGDLCAQAMYRLGLTLEALGDPARARDAYARAVKAGRPVWKALAEVETLRLNLEDTLAGALSREARRAAIEKASHRLRMISNASRAVDLAPAGARARLQEARTWLKIPDEAKAVASFDQTVMLFPSEEACAAQALLEKAELYRKFGDSRKLIAVWLDLVKRYPRQIPWSETAAWNLLSLKIKDADTATQDSLLRQAAADYTNVPIVPALAVNMLGDRASDRKNATSAVSFYRSVIAQFPGEKREAARAKLSLARILTERGDYEEAFRLFREADLEFGAFDPLRVQAWRRLVGNLAAKGRSELSGGDPKLAIRTFRDLIAFDYDIPQAHRGLVAAYAALGEIFGAVSLYKEEIRKYPDRYLPRYALGLAYTYVEPPSHGFDLAEPELDRAIRMNGQAVFPHQTLGFVFEKRQELLKQPDYVERALDQYLIALSLSDPQEDFQNYADLTLDIGNGYFLLGDNGKAYEAYGERKKSAALFDPKEQELVFLERFARSAFHVGRPQEASDLADSALGLLSDLEGKTKLKPRESLSHRAEITDLKALASEDAGRHEEAARTYGEVARLNVQLGDASNQAKALRNMAINLFDAPASSGVERERRLDDARDTLTESLSLLGEHGAKTTKVRKTGVLLNFQKEVSLSADTSEAARGFSTKAETDLIYTFLGRIDRERRDPEAALAALDAKKALLPSPSSVNAEQKPAYILKRSILENQRGVVLAELRRFEEAAREFAASKEDAKSIGHATGITLNTLSLARLSRVAPKAVEPDRAVREIDETVLLVKKSGGPETARLLSNLALEKAEFLAAALASATLTTRNFSIQSPELLSSTLRDIREASTALSSQEGITQEDRVRLLEMDLVHFRWTSRRAVRSSRITTADSLRAEAEKLGRADLSLRARLLGWWEALPAAFDTASSALAPILACARDQKARDLVPALPELLSVLDAWLDLAFSAHQAEAVYSTLEWRQRIHLELARPPLPSKGRTPAEAEALRALRGASDPKAFLDALNILESGTGRDLASLFRLNPIDAAELMEVLGPRRRLVVPFLTIHGRGYLAVKTDGLSLSDTPPGPFDGDTYWAGAGPCTATESCTIVAGASHLFFALNSQSIFERRVFWPSDQAANPTPPHEAVRYGRRTELEKKAGLADWAVAPSGFASEVPSGGLDPLALRWVLGSPDAGLFEREIPIALLAESGASVLLFPTSPGAGATEFAFLADYLSRFGISAILVPSTTAAQASRLLAASGGVRLADAARAEGFGLFGALGLKAAEKTERASSMLEEVVAQAAQMYRAQEWNPSVRKFEEALSILAAADRPQMREEILDAAGTAAYRGNDLDRAVSLASQLVELRRSAKSPKLADSLEFLGILHSRQEKFGPAVAELSQATSLYETEGLPKKAAENLSTLGIVLENAKRYGEALAQFDRSLEMWTKEGSSESVGDQWRRIGRIYYLRLNDYAKARDAFEKAVKAFEHAHALTARDEALLELGLLEERRGAFDRARSTYQEVFARAKASKNFSLASKAALYTANTFWFEGNYFEAFRWQSKSLSLADQAKDDRMRLLCRSTAGLIFWTLNENDKAVREQAQALELAQKLHSPIDEASAYNNTGLVYRERGDFPKALEFFGKALAVDTDLKTTWGIAYDSRNIGITETRLRRYTDAERHLAEAARLSGTIGDKTNEAKALQSLGDLYVDMRKWDTAYPTLKRALELARDSNLKEVEWRSLWGLAKVTSGRKNDAGANVYLKEAIEIVEAMSASIKIEEFRSGFISNKMGLYEDMILLLLKGGSNGVAEAWSYAERARARSFIDLLGNRRIEPSEPADRQLLARERNSLRKIEELENRLAGAKTDEERKQVLADLDGARRTRTDLMIEIRAKRPELSSFVSVDVISLADLRKLIGSDTAFVEYFLTAREILAWVITDRAINLVRVPTPRNLLERKIVAYSKLMQSQAPLVKQSQELNALLWAPVEPKLEGKRFVDISPHGPLHYLPFSSLFNGTRYVADRYNLAFTPSASVLRYTLTGRTIDRSTVRVLAVGNPDLGNPAMALPFAEKEVAAIAWDFPRIETLTGKKATKQWIEAHAEEFNVIHLASHGEFDPINPLFSAILLAASKTGSGNLSAEEIFGLKLNADLVTLSACQTGLAKIEGGDELIGLNRAFLFAGTHSILSSLWRVNDVSTAVLIKHFYRNYVRASKAESLREAQLKVKDYYPHPSFWAAFFLTGDYR
ncbi:MAG: CHAT domain-containing protein [Pseudomonadota bacterium]